MNNRKYLIIGPHFRVNNKFTGEGGKLFYSLKSLNFTTSIVSKYRNKILRLFETVYFMLSMPHVYDTVLLQCYGQLAFVLEDITSFIAKKQKKKIVITLHGGAFIEFYSKYPKWVKRVISRADILTTPSRFLKTSLEKDFKNIHYLPNSISLEKFKFENQKKSSDSTINILWVRGFHNIYDPELAVFTIAELIRRKHKAHLTMVGKDIGQLKKCNLLVENLNLTDFVTFTGYIDNDELSHYYHSNDVFLTTTRYESFGVSLFEAAACGIVNLAIPVGELPYLWENGKNIVFAERDPKDLADKIIELHNNPDYKFYLIENAYSLTKQYNPQLIIKEWISLINK